MTCFVCGGPIGIGEPVVLNADGLPLHRFRSTCEFELTLEPSEDKANEVRNEGAD